MIYIYHIIERNKIGCTINLKKRMREHKWSGHYEILETHTDVNEASKREIELQEEYGYEVDDVTYAQTLFNSSKSNKSVAGLISSRSPNHVTKKKSHQSMAAKVSGLLQAQQVNTCPHCNKTIKGLNYKRWHGDNCKTLKQN